MTFYWWSHWFWITFLGIILFPITIVHTYPSQEISLEYNQNSRTLKTVTKLYQTTTTLTWVTSAPPNHKSLMGLTGEKTILQSVTPEMQPADDAAEEADEEQDEVEQDEQAIELAEEIDDEEDEVEDDEENISEEFEFKRSAENYNKTDVNPIAASSDNTQPSLTKVNEDGAEETHESGDDKPAASTGSVKLKREEGVVNNYTNFSSEAKALSTNSTSDNFTTPHELTSKSSASSSSAAPAAPRIDSPHTALEWFSAMAAQLPAAVTVNDDDDDDDGNSETVTAAHRAPFTLENVNKEEELRRAENEHRSRKSKVLSAEYKHINRFINFSTDSKNLLTRSASSAPNEFENDEGNISSEALAIQRTYFLDAGAISAICFTIFGVCCTVGTIGIVLYRRRYLNKPQALSEPDSSVYIDDSTMRDNSDEMYSLDNDSFLNSLEAMTIQNYWTDTVKHTKL